MFDHPLFEVRPFESVPLNCDLYLMDERWLAQYEESLVSMFNGNDYIAVGYISYAAIRRIDEFVLELSWYPNIHDRFHEVTVTLPRDQFIVCVGSPQCDEKFHIFVRSSWLTNLHLRPYSAFALVDAIGVKNAISRQQLSSGKLVELRSRIDFVAEQNPGISFVSFADSLLLKSNWSVGKFDTNVTYTYEPEALVKLLPQISSIYRDVLGLRIYAAITQGLNEYYDQTLLHISNSANHVCLNSLGLPFAQLLAIDDAVRNAIRQGTHAPADLYIDDLFYHSLRFRHGFDKYTQPSASYHAPLSEIPSAYYHCSLEAILNNLDEIEVGRRRKS
jgi:hypothetical protein